MSELIKTIKCSNCNANIQIDFNRPISYCSYCGSTLMLDVSTVQKWLIEKEKTAQVISNNNADVEKTKSNNIADVEKTKSNNITKIINENSVWIYMIIVLIIGFIYAMLTQ